MTEQQKEDEDEKDCGTKEMQMRQPTDILSTIDMAAEKLCDVDTDRERSSTVRREKEPCYTLIMKSCKKRRKNQNS